VVALAIYCGLSIRNFSLDLSKFDIFIARCLEVTFFGHSVVDNTIRLRSWAALRIWNREGGNVEARARA